MLGEGAVCAAPDLRIAVDPLEPRPHVLIVGVERQDLEDRFPRQHIALVAPQIEPHLHLPVERFGIRGVETGGGAEGFERGVAAHDGPRELDAADGEQ